MGLPISDLNQATRHKRSIVNNGAVELAAGAPVQVDYQNENGLYGISLSGTHDGLADAAIVLWLGSGGR